MFRAAVAGFTCYPGTPADWCITLMLSRFTLPLFLGVLGSVVPGVSLRACDIARRLASPDNEVAFMPRKADPGSVLSNIAEATIARGLFEAQLGLWICILVQHSWPIPLKNPLNFAIPEYR